MFRLNIFFGLLLSTSLFAGYKHQTKVYLDGAPYMAYFNDGDTFKIISEGEMKGVRARLQGFNALESYGPVHRWGDWENKELHAIAKAATKNAREGVWHCKSSGDKDGYRRLLVYCHDLTMSQIQKGLAHTMIMDDGFDPAPLNKAQQEAIHARLGMWKKGYVDYILTSAHSKNEKRLKHTYDRFVSTKTGLSVKREHSNPYDTCETVNYTPNEGKTASEMVYIPFEKRYGYSTISCR